MSNKKRTKYDKLVAVNEKLVANFSRIDHPSTQQLAKLLGSSGPGLWEEMKKKEPSVTRSQIAASLEELLRDLSPMVAALAPEVRSAAMSAFRDAVQAEYPACSELLTPIQPPAAGIRCERKKRPPPLARHERRRVG